MLDHIQIILSLQILGFCIFGGVTLLLRARENRAKQILGGGMLLWAFLAGFRISVNSYIQESKEIFHPDILIIGCFVMATLSCYMIEVLRPGYLTLKRFSIYISPIVIGSLTYLFYRLLGGEIHVYYSMEETLEFFNLDIFLRALVFLLMLCYMIIPAYLVIKYSKDFKIFLQENVSNPDEYDLDWLKKIMIILSAMYFFYIVLLFTDNALFYVIDKAFLLIIWYYFFYKALFLKVVDFDHSFENGWELPQASDDNEGDDEQWSILAKHYTEGLVEWFSKEKPYLNEDLRLTDLQRVFPISRSYLSSLFNKELGSSFCDYVNQWRIEESKRLLDEEPLSSIQEIAERSGFHSISTFRRAFYKSTGLTPSEYKRHKTIA